MSIYFDGDLLREMLMQFTVLRSGVLCYSLSFVPPTGGLFNTITFASTTAVKIKQLAFEKQKNCRNVPKK
ncbi:MAG: hypothetical protein ABI861_07880 [Panacibacter sp.]